MEQITLKLGETKRIKKSFLKGISLVYCGMLNDKVFSIGLKEQSGYHGYGMNFYFNANSHIINIKDFKLNIVRLTPEELVLETVI